MLAAVSAYFSLIAVSLASGDAAVGRAIAERWCASCHLVAQDQRSAADVPSFQSIARKPDIGESLLVAFLATSHPRMPDMSLSRQEIADLLAYIRGLR